MNELEELDDIERYALEYIKKHKYFTIRSIVSNYLTDNGTLLRSRNKEYIKKRSSLTFHLSFGIVAKLNKNGVIKRFNTKAWRVVIDREVLSEKDIINERRWF